MLFKKITVTEDNFEKILKRMQKICNSRYMINKYSVTEYSRTDGSFISKQNLRNGIFIRDKMEYDKTTNNFRKKRVVEIIDNFILVAKHRFRQGYEDGTLDKWDIPVYEKFGSLIHLSTGISSALVIHVGDQIMFAPFSAFVIWSKDNSLSTPAKLIYKNVFMPNYSKAKIKNFNEEIEKRRKAEEEEFDFLYSDNPCCYEDCNDDDDDVFDPYDDIRKEMSESM